MAAPNIAAIATVTGKSYGCAVGTSRTDLVPAVATGHVVKVNVINLANVDGSVPVDGTVEWYDASTTTYFKLGQTLSIPADGSVAPKEWCPLYLEEGDKLTVLASAAGDLEGFASGEDMS
ncbi:MAG: hypothetical protein Q8T13_04860 [Acidobacteriota bacterium]|nr:hypothetical protein [Acidobacteriota bacterium]